MLNKDYVVRSEIEIVLIEMADQVATRLRKSGAKTQLVGPLFTGYSINYIDQAGPASTRNPAHHRIQWVAAVRASWWFRPALQRPVDPERRRGCRKSDGTDFPVIDLFQEPDEQVNEQKKLIVDSIRKKYGFRSLVCKVSLLEGVSCNCTIGEDTRRAAGLRRWENAERNWKTDG